MCDKKCETCKHNYESIVKNCGNCRYAIKEYKSVPFYYVLTRLISCSFPFIIEALENRGEFFNATVHFMSAENRCDSWCPCNT